METGLAIWQPGFDSLPKQAIHPLRVDKFVAAFLLGAQRLKQWWRGDDGLLKSGRLKTHHSPTTVTSYRTNKVPLPLIMDAIIFDERQDENKQERSPPTGWARQNETEIWPKAVGENIFGHFFSNFELWKIPTGSSWWRHIKYGRRLGRRGCPCKIHWF